MSDSFIHLFIHVCGALVACLIESSTSFTDSFSMFACLVCFYVRLCVYFMCRPYWCPATLPLSNPWGSALPGNGPLWHSAAPPLGALQRAAAQALGFCHSGASLSRPRALSRLQHSCMLCIYVWLLVCLFYPQAVSGAQLLWRSAARGSRRCPVIAPSGAQLPRFSALFNELALIRPGARSLLGLPLSAISGLVLSPVLSGNQRPLALSGDQP